MDPKGQLGVEAEEDETYSGPISRPSHPLHGSSGLSSLSCTPNLEVEYKSTHLPQSFLRGSTSSPSFPGWVLPLPPTPTDKLDPCVHAFVCGGFLGNSRPCQNPSRPLREKLSIESADRRAILDDGEEGAGGSGQGGHNGGAAAAELRRCSRAHPPRAAEGRHLLTSATM